MLRKTLEIEIESNIVFSKSPFYSLGNPFIK
jgi:hypothetical protein